MTEEKPSTGKCMRSEEFPLTSPSKTEILFFRNIQNQPELVNAFFFLLSCGCISYASVPLPSLTSKVSESKSWPNNKHTKKAILLQFIHHQGQAC